jgi:hypothetical protein
MYTWHFTFDDQPAVRDLAALYQARLAGLPGLDLVPTRWLHLTTQDVGFTDDVGEEDLAAIIVAARRRLASGCRQRVRFGPACVTSEGILLEVEPAAGLMAVRAALRAAICDIWPADKMPGSAEWTPHVSVAYSNTSAPSAPYVTALTQCHATAQCLIQSVQLIVLGRDRHVYEWASYASVQLADGR